MSLRQLLLLLLTGSFVILAFFLFLSSHVLLGQIGLSVPGTISDGLQNLGVSGFLLKYGLLLLLLNIFVFGFVFLLLDRLIIKPVKAITYAMQDFAEHRKLEALPIFSRSTKEIDSLATVFVSFTDNVEQLHMRDMEMSRVKSDFISTAAHQLRTPLTGIRWALEALQKESLAPEQKALVDSAVSKSKDLVAVVGTLLDISSIESGKHKYVFTQVDLPALASEVTTDFTHLAQEKNVSVVFVQPEGFFPLVRADREQVKWVLNNLIENAIRYTPAGGGVQVSATMVPGRVQINVHDTGIGITEQDRNNIFERFYRAGNAIAKENAGNGLGLYIARTIATDHGGDLNFKSNTDGPGTTFILSLPTEAAIVSGKTTIPTTGFPNTPTPL